jgi:anti-sigma regulatory factor (Ser/Thr protein kinase)
VSKALRDVQDDVRDTAALLVSELVANALEHAATDIDVDVRRDKNFLRVEVSDGKTTGQLNAGDADPDNERGRGLFLVEQLAAEWGVQRRGRRKAVWFTLALH